MTTIDLTGIEAVGESLAVASGKRVLDAMRDAEGSVVGSIEIGVHDLDDEQWSEMAAYLGRRGVQVHGDVASVA